MERSFVSSPERDQAQSAAREPSPNAIRLVLAGHHPLTLCGLSHVFAQEDDCRVLGMYTDSEAVVEALRQHRPDILIVDVDLPRNGALTVLRRAQRERLSTHVVLLATASDAAEVVDGMRLGARAVVLKEMPPAAFVACVRKVYGGEQWVEGPSVSRLVGKLLRSGTSLQKVARQLTPRETEIARMAVLGVSTQEIATRLAVKQGTVKIHLHSIYDKLNVGGRLGLILFARRHGLV